MNSKESPSSRPESESKGSEELVGSQIINGTRGKAKKILSLALGIGSLLGIGLALTYLKPTQPTALLFTLDVLL